MELNPFSVPGDLLSFPYQICSINNSYVHENNWELSALTNGKNDLRDKKPYLNYSKNALLFSHVFIFKSLGAFFKCRRDEMTEINHEILYLHWGR